VAFTAPFRARPVVHCSGALTVAPEALTPTAVAFGGNGAGAYEITGE
jgi:hypothetical protein